MSRNEADIKRIREFIQRHTVIVCCKESGHCRCLLCAFDEIATATVLTSDEACMVYHTLTKLGVSSVADPVLYALRKRLSQQVQETEASPRFAWRVP